MDAAGTLRAPVPLWFAVQTKPRQEERAHAWLSNRVGLPVFLPRLEELKKRHSRSVRVVEPLFPSYLFVHMTLEPEPWYAVKWAPGVKRVVGTGEVPTPVPPEIISLLRARCGDEEVIHWGPAMMGGESVRVVHGPFAGLQGILERPSSRRERVRVLLTLMGCATAVDMDITDIELVA